jgi:hypothetical protein
MNAMNATYTGPNDRLSGQTALVRDDPEDPSMYLVQFDKNPLWIGKNNLASGWHQFFRKHFSVDAPAPIGTVVARVPVTQAAVDPRDVLPDGMWQNPGSMTIWCRCCVCDNVVEFHGDPQDVGDELKDYYCGGSPRCCP